MPGPQPKHPSTRARRNRTSTSTTLTAVKNPKIPALPKTRAWNAETRRWWKDVWSSPMSAEYLDTDQHALFRLAMLVDEYYNAADMGATLAMLKIASELRLQEPRFGLTPMDRRKLQWTVDLGEAAADRTEKRRSARKPKSDKAQEDPRMALVG